MRFGHSLPFRAPTIELRRPLRIVVLLLVSGLMSAALVLGWPELHRRPASAETGLPVVGRTGSPESRPATGGPVASPPAAAMSPDRLAVLLTALDAVRERAFAERRPELLSQVYASPALLAADTAQLIRSVPAGCRLTGVHTGYRDPTVGAPADMVPVRSVTVTVTATLAPAILSCAGVVRSRTRPAGPTALRLRLIDSGAGWRIASQRLG